MYMALWYGMKNAKTFGNLHSLIFNCENPGSMLSGEIYMVRRIQGIQYIIYVTGPAKINHVSAKKSPIFSVFAVS